MKKEYLKYLIPIVGLLKIWDDIPHTPNQYPYKPLQGDDILSVITWSWISTGAFLSTILYLLS